ncbi:MAG: hypothetical protein RLN63_10405, partial [Miltoncostaeaceae bacterium]
MPRRSPLLAALALTASLAAAAPASADSISYIRDGDVWLSTTDGQRQFQVTSTGLYSYASQADDGTLIALAGERLHRLDRMGNITADFPTPVSDGPPPDEVPAWDDTVTNYFNGPFEPEISPDGRLVSYTYFWQHYTYDYVLDTFRNRLESGTAITRADGLTAWSDFGGPLTGWRYGSWLDSDTLMRTEAGVPLAEDVVFNDIVPGGGGELRRWFRNYRGYDRADGELNRQQTMLALGGDGPAEEGGRHLRIYRTLGPGNLTEEPEACFQVTDDAATDGLPPRSASWSPDGLSLAFQDSEGIKTLAVGDQSPGCFVPAESGLRLLLPGATQPDWGPADVPASRPVPNPPPPAPGTPVTPGAPGAPGQPAGPATPRPATGVPSGAKVLRAKAVRTRLGAAMRAGIGLRFRAPSPG